MQSEITVVQICENDRHALTLIGNDYDPVIVINLNLMVWFNDILGDDDSPGVITVPSSTELYIPL